LVIFIIELKLTVCLSISAYLIDDLGYDGLRCSLRLYSEPARPSVCDSWIGASQPGKLYYLSSLSI